MYKRKGNSYWQPLAHHNSITWGGSENDAYEYSLTLVSGESENINQTEWGHFFFFLINLFIYLFLAALGLRCCVLAFSSCGERGLLFVVVRGLLIVVASLVVKHGL